MRYWRIIFAVLASIWWIIAVVDQLSSGQFNDHSTEMFAIFLVGYAVLSALSERSR